MCGEPSGRNWSCWANVIPFFSCFSNKNCVRKHHNFHKMMIYAGKQQGSISKVVACIGCCNMSVNNNQSETISPLVSVRGVLYATSAQKGHYAGRMPLWDQSSEKKKGTLLSECLLLPRTPRWVLGGVGHLMRICARIFHVFSNIFPPMHAEPHAPHLHAHAPPALFEFKFVPLRHSTTNNVIGHIA